LSTPYFAHGDPSKSNANFGFAIAHVELDTVTGFQHVVFDVLHAWLPGDYPNNNYEIDYLAVEAELKAYMDAFMPNEFTFDNFNSVGTMQRLRQHARDRRYPTPVTIYERTATRQRNWQIAENFKSAIGLGLVHAPHHELAELELKYLQDVGGRVQPPTSGPVQTKDVADCIMILVSALIGDQIATLMSQLGEMPLRGSVPGGIDPYKSFQEPAHEALSSSSQLFAGRSPSSAARGGRFDQRLINRQPRVRRDFTRRRPGRWV
jgi:hypothetical protein